MVRSVDYVARSYPALCRLKGEIDFSVLIEKQAPKNLFHGVLHKYPTVTVLSFDLFDHFLDKILEQMIYDYRKPEHVALRIFNKIGSDILRVLQRNRNLEGAQSDIYGGPCNVVQHY